MKDWRTWIGTLRPWSLGVVVLLSFYTVRGELPLIQRMHRVHVQSEAIISIGYHHKTKTLEVEFQSHETYRYARVPIAVYKDFLAAESKGHYFQNYIRGHYDYWKLGEP